MRYLFSVITLLLGTASLHAFDTQKRAMFQNYYSQYTQETLAQSTLFADAEETMELLLKGEQLFFLDMRTEAEMGVVGLKLPNSAQIALDKLFLEENLKRLPSDGTVMLVCYSGTRAAMAATALQMLGIKNIRVLKGGVKALAQATTPLTAPKR
jgi:rhodanese-related sulfurtransferase